MLKRRKKEDSLSGAVRNYYLVFNTLLLLVFGVIMLAISTRILIEKVEDTSETITEQAGNSLDKTLNDIATQMVNFSSYRDLINQLSKSSLSIQEELNLERELTSILKKTDLFNSVVQDIFVISDNGFVFSTATKSGLAASYDYLSQDWYQKAKDTTGNIYVRMLGLHPQDFYSTAYTFTSARSTFSMSFALKNSRGNVIGALIYNFDLKQMADVLKSSNYEENGTVALLDESGIIVSQSNDEQIGEQLPLSPGDFEKITENDQGMFWASLNGKSHLVNYKTTSMGMKLVSYVPRLSIFMHIWSMVLLLLLTMSICLGINLLIAFHVTRSIKKPIEELTGNIQKVDSEHLSLEAEGYRYQELNQIAGKFSQLLNRLDILIQKDYKSQILLNKFRLYSLQSQINPHFLMNTLQQLQTEIVYGNVSTSNEIVVSLSKMLRYSLYHYEAIVPISQEIQYIQSYLNLFTQKYEGELSVSFQVAPESEGYCMPKMLLQPVVENCIMHAFDENPKGAVILLSVAETEAGFSFTVRDNGHGMSPGQLQQVIEDLNVAEIDNRRIGIRNIHQRIRLLYGKDYGVEIKSQEGLGTGFTLRIPKIGRTALKEPEQGGTYETLDY